MFVAACSQEALPAEGNGLPRFRHTLQVTHMEEVGRRNLWINAQQDQAMDMQYSQMQGSARSGESLHAGSGRGAAKSPMVIFAQTPSPPAPTASRPYPQSNHTVSPLMKPSQAPATIADF